MQISDARQGELTRILDYCSAKNVALGPRFRVCPEVDSLSRRTQVGRDRGGPLSERRPHERYCLNPLLQLLSADQLKIANGQSPFRHGLTKSGLTHNRLKRPSRRGTYFSYKDVSSIRTALNPVRGGLAFPLAIELWPSGLS
jgi:hypothetical protein